MPGTSIGQSNEGAVNIPVTTGEIPGSPVASTVPERDLKLTDIKPPIEASPDAGKTVTVPVQGDGQDNAALSEAFGKIDQAATSGQEFREDAPVQDGEPVKIVGADTRAAVASSLSENDQGKSLADLEKNVSIDGEEDPQTVLPTAATVPGPPLPEPSPVVEPAPVAVPPVPRETPVAEPVAEPAPVVVPEPAPREAPVAEPVPVAEPASAVPDPESQLETTEPAQTVKLADIPPDQAPVIASKVEIPKTEEFAGIERALKSISQLREKRDRADERIASLTDEVRKTADINEQAKIELDIITARREAESYDLELTILLNNLSLYMDSRIGANKVENNSSSDRG